MTLKDRDREIRESFSTSLRLARRILGIDQAEAAKRMGISTRQVGELERQSVAVKAFHIIALYDSLKVKPELSMGLTENRVPTVEDIIRSIDSLSSEHELKGQVFWQEFIDAVTIKQQPDDQATPVDAAAKD